jgi:hypothetical protein
MVRQPVEDVSRGQPVPADLLEEVFGNPRGHSALHAPCVVDDRPQELIIASLKVEESV